MVTERVEFDLATRRALAISGGETRDNTQVLPVLFSRAKIGLRLRSAVAGKEVVERAPPHRGYDTCARDSETCASAPATPRRREEERGRSVCNRQTPMNHPRSCASLLLSRKSASANEKRKEERFRLGLALGPRASEIKSIDNEGIDNKDN